MSWRFALAVLGSFLYGCGTPADVPTTTHAQTCGKVGTWLDPATGKSIAPGPLMADLARRSVVLLGEQHDNAEHHRWQLQILAALHAHNPNMIVGFEMFPRRVQPALDRWAAGALDVRQFLKESDWQKVWGFDPELYMPLFHFVRQNRLAMIALNVDRALITRVGQEGWAAIPTDRRSGLSDPAKASDPYRRYLAEVFANSHRRARADTDLASVMKDGDFKRFVAAQLTWDRAMAEALAEARRKQPAFLVVGVMGQGHARSGHGVPHQLTDLGVADTAVLLPVESADACKELPATIADAVFVVEPPQRIEQAPAKPRFGVMIEKTDKGVRVMQVVKGSVAEASDLVASDIVVSAAGRQIEKVSQLIAIIRRQAPGTWLPLTIRRAGRVFEVVAKFPPNSPTEHVRPK
jgi:uncharacterized iron-regulated protein